jgi:hypothetical protein
MKMQPPSDDRMVMSQQLALLSMTHDFFGPKVFEPDFLEFVQAFKAEGRKHGVKVEVRHLAKADGRQRFLIFLDGKHFDTFDFGAVTVGGFPGDDPNEWPDSDDISQQPFSVQTRET